MIVSWNVSGFNQRVKQKKLKVFLRTNKVSIIAIYEHRVKVERSRSINKVIPGWKWCVNATNQSRGRIWVAWDPNRVKYEMMEHSIQFIYRKIQLRKRKNFTSL